MRTSRVSKETSQQFKREADATVAPRRSTRSSLARFAFNNNRDTVKEEVKPEIKEEDDDSSELSELEFGSDIEDTVKKSSRSPPHVPLQFYKDQLKRLEQENKERVRIARQMAQDLTGGVPRADGGPGGPDGETATATRKRKRATKTTTTPRGRVKIEKNESSESEIDFTSVPQSQQSSSSSRRVRKPVRTITSPSGAVKIEPPSDWEEMYALVKEMRISGPAKNAAVDTMGCERLADDDATPRDRRFHTLVALMLSSQTKDTVNAEAMKRLKKEMPACAPGRPKGLNLENMLAVEPGVLNEMIGKVGFHNNKTK
jgi:endonuclease-3